MVLKTLIGEGFDWVVFPELMTQRMCSLNQLLNHSIIFGIVLKCFFNDDNQFMKVA